MHYERAVIDIHSKYKQILEEKDQKIAELKKRNKDLIGFLEKECRMCTFGGLNGCTACLLNEDCGRLDMLKKAKGKQS
jgi:hypothetical protein